MNDIINWIKKEIDSDFNPDFNNLPCLQYPYSYGYCNKYNIDYSKDWVKDAVNEYNKYIKNLELNKIEELNLFVSVEQSRNMGDFVKAANIIQVYIYSRDLPAPIYIKEVIQEF